MINIYNFSLEDGIILSLFLVTIIGLIITQFIFKKNKLHLGGTNPINKNLYIVGKIGIWGTWIALILQSLQINLRIIQITHFSKLIAIILIVLSFSIFFISFFNLGSSLRMGLPKEKTELKINGIYKLSRNPIYVAFYLLSIASILYTLNPIIIIFAILGIYIHHKIVIAEEIFLKQKFKQRYDKYIKRVRRYI